MLKLLDRDSFREGIFARDNHTCVMCGKPAQDAHHILERRLFPDGGYYFDNGVSLCGDCHIKAEQTLISCEEIREKCKIEKVILPPHFYEDTKYDKWGNPYLENNFNRSKGELYDDVSVQKILPDSIKATFVKHVKYPRTYHLPWSPGLQNDDRMLPSTDVFIGKQVVVTAKMDGENTTAYTDYMHARSLSSEVDLSKHWVKKFLADRMWEIPDGWRFCGENLYACHSIFYHNLETFFMLFSVWNEKNMCLSWTETLEWAKLLDIAVVPVLYEGIYDEEKIKSLYQPVYNDCEMEGYVVRLADSFHYRDFRHSAAKYVRASHIKTNEHWKRSWKPNKLTGG